MNQYKNLCQDCLAVVLSQSKNDCNEPGLVCPACGAESPHHICNCPDCLATLKLLEEGERRAGALGITCGDIAGWTPERGIVASRAEKEPGIMAQVKDVVEQFESRGGELFHILSYSTLGHILRDLVTLDEEWREPAITALKDAVIKARKHKLLMAFESGNGKVTPVYDLDQDVTSFLERGNIEGACSYVAGVDTPTFPESSYRDWEPNPLKSQS